MKPEVSKHGSDPESPDNSQRTSHGWVQSFWAQLNRAAQSQMTCERRLAIVAGASHLFEEPGALERVAALASEWFVEYLVVETAS